MNIYSFHKITRPVYEGGLTIDCSPRGKFLVEVRRTDGTIRRPFGDHLIENTFLNQWRDGQLGGTAWAGSGDRVANGFGWSSSTSNITSSEVRSWTDLFYGARSSIAIGSGSASASASNTALGNQIRFDSTPHSGGNAVTWSQSTGDVVYTIKEAFPAETGSVTYREAGIRISSGSTNTDLLNGLAANASRLINRVVFPADVTLVSGESLILTLGITIPTLARTTGKTITISAQNGVNISGSLRLISSQAGIVGGTVTGAGVVTRDINLNSLWSPNTVASAGLSTKTAFDTQGTEPTWGTTNFVHCSWSSYTNGNYYRDASFTWPSGTPSTSTNFRSILMRHWNSTYASAQGGYHLLLDNQQTKASTGALAFTMRFSV